MRLKPCRTGDRRAEEQDAASLADRLVSEMGPPWPGPAAYHGGLFERVMRFACEMYGTPPRTALELLERLEMSLELCDLGVEELLGLGSIDVNDVYRYCRGYFAHAGTAMDGSFAEGSINFEAIDLEDLLKDRRSRWRRIKDAVLSRLSR